MNKVMAIVILAGLLTFAGCNAVQVSPEYNALVDTTAAWSRAVADRAAAGEMTETEKTDALDVSADLWERFQDAKDGAATKGGDE